ncbi:hypothetical protein ACVWV0_004626 [Ewingella americana]
MTSMLAKISEAIDASRADPQIIITETIQIDNTGKIFVSGVMDGYVLSKWDAVFTSTQEWATIQFIDDYGDNIAPSQARSGERNNVTIIFENDSTSPYIFTPEGWRLFLFNDAQVSRASKVHLAFISEGFKTIAYKVKRWTEKPEINNTQHTEINNSNSARNLVKYFSSSFLPTEKPSAWILESNIPINNPAFEIWKEISCKEILKCLPNEIFVNENPMVGLSGKPPKKILFGKSIFTEQDFFMIQSAAKWVYFEGEEVELKHTFLSNELAREWPDGLDFCEGISVRLSPALESARLLYKAHIRSSSKETLKALGDLRKNLADDMQKIVQQSKDLASSLWKDVALVISTLVLKYTLDAAKVPNSSKIYSIVFFSIALYILISHFTTVLINSNFIRIIEENRMSWRKKLYGYLDEGDYNELATTPVKKAYRSYRLVRNICTGLIIVLAMSLFALGISEHVNLHELLTKIIKSSCNLFEQWFNHGPKL